jgi:DNA topoisomerase-3
MIDPKAIFRLKHEAFVTREADNEMVMVPLVSDIVDMTSVLTLNEVASDIVKALDGKKTLDEICRQIFPDYDVDENILKNDLLAAFISIPETTRWEERLHEDTSAFIDGVKDFVRNAVKNTGMGAYQREKTPLGKCPLCGGDIFEGKKNYYCGNYKAEKPCRFAVWKEICQAALTPSDLQTLLAGKQTKVKKCASKAGKEFTAAFILEKGKVEFRFEDKKK